MSSLIRPNAAVPLPTVLHTTSRLVISRHGQNLDRDRGGLWSEDALKKSFAPLRLGSVDVDEKEEAP